ncbi:hypothetical protein FA13DRAFT_1723810 [Coprinellus micaceus]|uniref:Uncharacterized protein n=1 Tax=Coprinellus micaceus TaxID=71717 RepID=A0A4Y7U1C8_COPMI|nr:hypothetical protein FA13DRAFT_1723810 [Coprinellus micaceus]
MTRRPPWPQYYDPLRQTLASAPRTPGSTWRPFLRKYGSTRPSHLRPPRATRGDARAYEGNVGPEKQGKLIDSRSENFANTLNAPKPADSLCCNKLFCGNWTVLQIVHIDLERAQYTRDTPTTRAMAERIHCLGVILRDVNWIAQPSNHGIEGAVDPSPELHTVCASENARH